MPDERPVLTANQLVGYNLKRVRMALGLDQAQARERLKPFGLDLSKNVYSAAERSFDGKRVRQFTGDELLAMSLAFGVTVGYFLTPPRPEDRLPGVIMVSGEREVGWQHLLLAANGNNLPPAVQLRVRQELPKDEWPTFPPTDEFAERYGAPPGWTE